MKANTPATPMESFLDKFRRARNAGTPLFSISCFDPAATMSRLQSNIVGASDPKDEAETLSSAEKATVPMIQWDIIDGWRHRNKAGAEAIDEACNKVNADQMNTINPVESLKIALALPDSSIVFMMNAQHYIEQGDFLQALWNTRDDFKSRQCSIILVGPDVTIPAQLQHDIFVIDEPLPTEQELRGIIKGLIDDTSIKLTKEQENDAVDALRGLSAFPAEQSVAMNMRKSGLDITGLWERKQKLISSTPGLRVYDGPEKFSDIGGCDQIKRFMNGVINGKDAPNAIVFIDEGEKMFAGAVGDVGDSSGVSQDFLGTTLSYMEDNEADGAIFYGPPGAAKSAIAKATGNEAGVPTIMLDLGGMKGGLVGKSEAQIRNAFKVITAVAGGRVFFVMTCNKIVELPPELRRRFTSGIFFFDLPTKPERELIWPLYTNRWGLDLSQVALINDEGWTGAEIRNCCRLAYRQEISIPEAAKYIVPVSKSAASQIQQLRRQASGAYLSANEDGIYEWADPSDKKAIAAPRRTLNLED